MSTINCSNGFKVSIHYTHVSKATFCINSLQIIIELFAYQAELAIYFLTLQLQYWVDKRPGELLYLSPWFILNEEKLTHSTSPKWEVEIVALTLHSCIYCTTIVADNLIALDGICLLHPYLLSRGMWELVPSLSIIPLRLIGYNEHFSTTAIKPQTACEGDFA